MNNYVPLLIPLTLYVSLSKLFEFTWRMKSPTCSWPEREAAPPGTNLLINIGPGNEFKITRFWVVFKVSRFVVITKSLQPI